MKASVFLSLAALLGLNAEALAAKADSTGMPGDHLDLYAVMEQFKKSDNLESFEKAINDPNNKINNLDLNQDGQTDYIRVIDNADSGAHAIVLQVPYNATESQDVAVIEVEQNGVENATVRIVGDEDVYGENYVVEPYESYVGKEEYDARQQRSQNNNNNNVTTRTVVNVYTWPVVTYIYRPVYRPWRSPWYWGYYPGWWRPWRPYHWHVYHGYMSPYHGPAYCYHRTYVYHPRRANHVYYAHRSASPSYKRTAPVPPRQAARGNSRLREKDMHTPGGRYNNNRHNGNSHRSREGMRENNAGPKVNGQPRGNGRQQVKQPRQNRQSAPRQQHHNGGNNRQRAGGGKRGG